MGALAPCSATRSATLGAPHAVLLPAKSAITADTLLGIIADTIWGCAEGGGACGIILDIHRVRGIIGLGTKLTAWGRACARVVRTLFGG